MILILLISLASQATVYYVSASDGSDSDSGLSEVLAWQTLTKVNATTFTAGDIIKFKKSDGWYGTLIINQSGIVGSPITYTTYGTGSTPTITGFTTISGWTDEGSGIYSKVITSDSKTYAVTVDGANTGMGRYPNSTYLIYESASTNTSITDNQLTGSPNWTGAEVVIRKNDWALERRPITNHTTTTITYSGTGWNGTAGNGYFIQNNLQTLDQLGEWYHNTSTGKFYMYFGAVNPDTKIVKVATKNYIVDIQGETYITIDGLKLEGSIKQAIYTSIQSNNFTIQNSTIQFTGGNGIQINGLNSLIDNCIISNCHENGIKVDSNNLNITNNNIFNCGIVKGGSAEYSMGIMANVISNTTIEYNSISNTGYNGIGIWGNNNIIRRNFITYTCLTLNDGGGIYTSGVNATGTLIDSNVILHAVGNIDGGNTVISISEGIYLDELSTGITVQNNTVAYCGYSGIKLHRANTNIIQNNTCYGNTQTGIYILNGAAMAYTHDNTISGNIFVAKSAADRCLVLNDGFNAGFVVGAMNNNIYARPIADTSPIGTNTVGFVWVLRTLSQWQTWSGQDANSTKSPFAISLESDLRFEYNATSSTVVVALDQNYRNISTDPILNNQDHTSYTLAPYSSVVLMKHAAYPSTATRKNVTYNKKTVVYHKKALRY